MVGITSRVNNFKGTGTRNTFIDRRQQWNGNNRFQPYIRPAITNMVRNTESHPRFNQYTELIKTPRQILATEGAIFPVPPKQRPTANKNSNKFCEYHLDKGHDTNDCWVLKQEIEKAVKTCRLAYLIKTIKDGRGGPAVHKVIGMEISFPTIGPREVHEDPVIISAVLAGHQVRRIYLDNGSALEIMYFQCFQQLEEEVQRGRIFVENFTYDLFGSKGPFGAQYHFRSDSHQSTKGDCVYLHGAIKFPTPRGLVTMVTESGVQVAEIRHSTGDQKIEVGVDLSEETKQALWELLFDSLDVFAWQPSDMTGVPRKYAEHKLKVYDSKKPVQQKKRGMGAKRSKAVMAVVRKLVEAEILRPVHYQTWVANPVMDCYPLPDIDEKVDAVAGFRFKCFLDAYKGYHQIQMCKEDEDKTAFIIKEGVMVDSDCIWVNPSKVEVVLKMTAPKSVKDIMTLNGRLVAMQQFLSKAAEKSLPFMKREKKLYLYLAVAKSAVSSVLMVERIGVQILIYYVSRVLKDYEERYSVLEKLVLSLLYTSRRLRRYFQAHTMVVLTNQPIQQVLRKPKISGRLVKWAIELGPFEIEFKTRISFKGRVLADFLAEFTDGEESVACDNVASEIGEWVLHTDGASNDEGAGAGLILVSPEGDELTYALKLNFPSSNNEAEYEAFLVGLRLAHKVGAKRLKAHVDSLLIANQISGEYEAKDENMAKYLGRAKMLLQSFDIYEVVHVSRSKNKKTDSLSKLALVAFKHLSKDVRVEVLDKPSVQVTDVCVVDVIPDNWMVPIVEFIVHNKIPLDKAEARKMKVRSLQYQVLEGRLYKSTFLGPLLRCLDPEEASYVIREIHWGICGIHAGPQMVVAKVERANRSIVEGLKVRLSARGSSWADELAHVLWAHQTMPKTSTGETPFSLTYGTEAVVPVEIGMPTQRMLINEDNNEKSLRENLDLLEKRREVVAIREAKYKKKVEQYYNKRVAPCVFKEGDYVLRCNDASRVQSTGKMGPRWEGPYVIKAVVGKGAYVLNRRQVRAIEEPKHASGQSLALLDASATLATESLSCEQRCTGRVMKLLETPPAKAKVEELNKCETKNACAEIIP
ncbi:hypothetical protein QVD17_16586 [Tagetes erecta]|uniref:RNase H type-1 domain-containing protein n=1 Tax=Tagetes erecta TaxID=13708 RepID=A0AAD8P0T9_TARER|nr:hypothetical protein QVD17_16586 [Tagetes erecta]